jgi:hypothetical protein
MPLVGDDVAAIVDCLEKTMEDESGDIQGKLCKCFTKQLAPGPNVAFAERMFYAHFDELL